MITIGILLFIIIVGTSTVHNRRRRYAIDQQLLLNRKENKNAIDKLTRITQKNSRA